jgi:hypothetical protein
MLESILNFISNQISLRDLFGKKSSRQAEKCHKGLCQMREIGSDSTFPHLFQDMKRRHALYFFETATSVRADLKLIEIISRCAHQSDDPGFDEKVKNAQVWLKRDDQNMWVEISDKTLKWKGFYKWAGAFLPFTSLMIVVSGDFFKYQSMDVRLYIVFGIISLTIFCGWALLYFVKIDLGQKFGEQLKKNRPS